MRIEYDSVRDLLYISFASLDAKAAETITVAPGVYADFTRDEKLMGIEVIDASEIIGEKIELGLPEATKLVPKIKTKDAR